MMFTPNQVEELLQIIRFQHILFGVELAGTNVLSKSDLDTLRKFGIDPSFVFEGTPTIEQAFQFGRIASALGNYQAKKVTYNDFKKFVRSGGHRALSARENAVLRSIQNQSFQAVKGLGERVVSDFNKINSSTESKRRSQYEKILRKELSEGVINRKSVQEIVLELGKRTGDWQRDLGRLVETESHNAYEEGRASELQSVYGDSVLVYKDVYAGACRHCIKAYLTNGINSAPKIFKLSVLTGNGTNVGKKSDEWLPVVGGMHPHCRCTLNKLEKGYEWDAEKRMFTTPNDYKQRYAYNVDITIGNNTFHI